MGSKKGGSAGGRRDTCGAGDLYQEYAEMIYRFIFLKCNDRDLAEDIVQTTFLKAILQIHTFEGKSKVSTWLCQIARKGISFEWIYECIRFRYIAGNIQYISDIVLYYSYP